MSLRLATAHAAALACLIFAPAALAADFPAPKQGVWVAKDF